MMSADMFAMCVLFSGLAAEMKVAGASKSSEAVAAGQRNLQEPCAQRLCLTPLASRRCKTQMTFELLRI